MISFMPEGEERQRTRLSVRNLPLSLSLSQGYIGENQRTTPFVCQIVNFNVFIRIVFYITLQQETIK